MPVKDKSKYPKNWREIRFRILERDKCRCKICGVVNGDIGYRDKKEKWHKIENSFQGDVDADDARRDGYRIIKIVLTIAHLDHDVSNNDDSNLAALCQLHHLRHDIKQHKKNSRETRDKKRGLQKLF